MLDFKYALRSLARARGYALAVVLTLGLGIGANTAIFSVVRGVLLRPLPHENGDRLMYLRHSMEGAGGENILFSVPEIEDFRAQSRTLQAVAEYSPMAFTLLGESDAIRIDVALVTGNFFSVMGLAPVLGRPFDARDDGAAAERVMVLTHEFWRTRFGGDPAIVGQTVRAGGQPVRVVGVLQPAPHFPQPVDVYMNMVNSEHHLSAMMVTGRSHRMTEMIARLEPGATVEQARTEVAALAERMHGEHPEAYDAASGWRVTMTPFHEVLGERARLTLWLLMGAAAFVLIIACANVANLTLMRGMRREHELAVRAALGSGVARLRRLLLAEHLLLALAGSVLGLVIAFAGVDMLVTFAERYSPRANEIRVDGAVLAFTLTLAVLVAVLLSFAPRLAREDALGATLTSAGGRTTGGVRRQRLQQTLVVAQIAVSVLLLTGAGLLVRTMQRLAEVDPGLQSENVLTMEVPLDFGGQSDEAAYSLYEHMHLQLASVPGVSLVGYGSTVPLRAAGFLLDVKAESRALAPGEPQPRAEYRTASADYFGAAGIPVLQGRVFNDGDRPGSPRVVVLNESLAELLFGDRDPIGQRVAWTGDVLQFIPVSGDWRTVVGVVGDTRDGGLDAPPLPVMFMPFKQESFPSGGMVIRSRGDAEALVPVASRLAREVAPQQPIQNVLTLDQIRDESIGPRRLNAMLVGSFGVLALIVAAVGIAAVLAFSVAARTNEIGVRMSLGADSWRIQGMILSQGGLLVIGGLVLGVVGALWLSRFMQGLLFGIEPHDPATLTAVVMMMAAVGIGACWLPALRAARIEPTTALKAQ